MKNVGRAEDRVKVCLGDRESGRKSKWEIKEVRRIYRNPVETKCGFLLLSQTQGPTVHLDVKRQEQH